MPAAIPPTILAALQRVEPSTSKFFPSSGNQFQSTTSNKTYFAKEGAPEDAEQYRGEAAALRVMYEAAPGICPRLFESSVDAASRRPVFVSEYKSLAPLNKHSAAALGGALAEMHVKGTSPTGMFGFDVPTYCGATRMENGWSGTWAEAYDRMIAGLLDRLNQGGQYQETCTMGEEVRKR